MNKKIKCILIDLDGTIINSGPDLIDSLNFVLRNQNIKPVEKSNYWFISRWWGQSNDNPGLSKSET